MTNISIKSKKSVSKKVAAKKDRPMVCVAINIHTNESVETKTVTEMAALLNTSRTNVSDVCNDHRPNRITVRDRDGQRWAVASA